MGNTAIQFSGGKDSLAVLYLCRPILPQATVYFGDTGDVYPHMVEFVHETCAKLGAKLKVVPPPMALSEFHRFAGLPSDIVPVERTWEMRQYTKRSGEVLQSNLSCCNYMLWQPLQRAMIQDGVTTIYRGSKAADGHVGVADGYVENGITYKSPIWNWSDEDVFTYLASVGAETPEHYATVNSSFDCLMCTAYLTSVGARERLEFTKRRYPERWPELQAKLRSVREAVDVERSSLEEAFKVLEMS